MTGEEAATGAAERHEFRGFDRGKAGSVDVVRFVCHGAGCVSANYLEDDQARRAHERHQAAMGGRGRRR